MGGPRGPLVSCLWFSCLTFSNLPLPHRLVHVRWGLGDPRFLPGSFLVSNAGLSDTSESLHRTGRPRHPVDLVAPPRELLAHAAGGSRIETSQENPSPSTSLPLQRVPFFVTSLLEHLAPFFRLVWEADPVLIKGTYLLVQSRINLIPHHTYLVWPRPERRLTVGRIWVWRRCLGLFVKWGQRPVWLFPTEVWKAWGVAMAQRVQVPSKEVLRPFLSPKSHHQVINYKYVCVCVWFCEGFWCRGRFEGKANNASHVLELSLHPMLPKPI